MAPSDLQVLQPRRSWDELIAYSRHRGRALRRRRHGLTAGSSLFVLLFVVGGVLVSAGGSSKERLATVRPTGPAAGGSTSVESGPDGIAVPGVGSGPVVPGKSQGRKERRPGARPSQARSAQSGMSKAAASGLLSTDRVAFTSNDGGEFAQIDVVNGDGSGGRAVLSHDLPFNDFSPAWSPEGRHLAFVSDRDNPERRLHILTEIYVMNADGSAERRLTHAIAGGNGNSDPAWSPDGTRIAYTGDDADGAADIWAIAPDGTGATNLTYSPGVEDYSPAWSPDGTRIAFVRYTSGASQLWAMNADGSGQRRLTNGATSSQRPSWSPDGRSIAFDRTGADGLRHVWVVGADGAGPRALVSAPGESSWPVWSPDGSNIVFGHDPDGSMEPSQDVGSARPPDASQPGAIYVIGLDGSDMHRLTNPAIGTDDYAPAVHGR